MKSTSNVFHKIGLFFAVLALVFCFGMLTVSSASFSAYAKAETKPDKYIGPQITIINPKTIYTLEDLITTTVTKQDSSTEEAKGVKLPLVTSADALTVTAKNAAGVSVEVYADDKVAEDLGGAYFLTPNLFVGSYTVTYKATKNGVDAVKEINVNFDSQKIQFEDVQSVNTANIIPNVVNPSATLKFGYPNVIVGSGDTAQTISSSDTTKGTLTVTVYPSSGGAGTILTPNEGVFTYNVPADAQGNYKVKYSYTFKDTNQTIAKSYSFQVASTEEFNPATDVELKINSWSSSPDSITLEVGKEVTLPTPTVINAKNNESITTYNKITAEYFDTANSVWVKTSEQPITNYKFTPTKVGRYRFSYECSDFYGSTPATKVTSEFKANLVSSTLGIKLSKETYDPTSSTFNYNDLEDARYMVPSIIEAGSTFTIPAMAVTSYGDFELDYSFTIDGESVEKYYETKSFTFTDVKTYQIIYSVAYKSNPTIRVQRSFEVQVVQSIAKTDVTLDGAINGLGTTVRAGSTLNFTTESSDIVTNSALTSLYEQTADAYVHEELSATIAGVAADVIKNDDGSYSVKVPSGAANASSVVVTLQLTDDLGNVKVIEKTLTVSNPSSDVVAPVLDVSAITSLTDPDDFQKNSGEEVSVLPVTATDAQSTASVNVKVKNAGNTILDQTVVSLNNGTNNVASIDANDFKFVLGNSGIYYVTYTATDANGNETIFAYQLWSESNSTPGLTLSGIPAKVNTGETIDLSSIAQASKDGAYLNYQTVVIANKDLDATTIKDYITTKNIPTNSIVMLVKGEFEGTDSIITAKGDIDITAWAYGDNADVDKRIDTAAFKTATITVVDETKPQFTIAGQGETDRNIALETGGTEIIADWFATVDDNALGYAGSGVKSLSVKAKYQSDSENLLSVTKAYGEAITEDELKFTANKNGKINVTYTVADNANNEQSLTLIYWVGDCVSPVVTLGDQDLTKTITTGGKFELDLTQLKATDDGHTYTYGDSGMTFTIKLAKDGTDISSKATTANNKWTVENLEAGAYVLTVSATDSANNVSVLQSKTFKVESKSAGKVSSTTVWGTILIILALVILAGVIFFFVKPTKGKVKVAQAKKLENKEKEETEVKKED